MAQVNLSTTDPGWHDTQKIGLDKVLASIIGGAGGGGGGIIPPPVCATANTVLLHDEMLYGWEAIDNSTPWTGPLNITDVDAATFDTAFNTSALSTGKPVGACDTALRCTFTGVSGYDTYRFDRGSIIAVGTNVDIKFYVYVQAPISGVSRSSILVAGTSAAPTGGLAFAVELRDNGGVNEIRADNVTSSAWIALTANSWNLIHVHIDATNTLSTVAVNGGAAQGFTSSATQGIQYVYAGACFAGATAAGQWVTDLVAVNTP